VADGFVARNRSKCALVIGAETMTRLMDWTDRGTCVLFGDGAGAIVVEPVEGEGTTADRGLLGFALRADGTKQELLYVDGGVSTNRQNAARKHRQIVRTRCEHLRGRGAALMRASKSAARLVHSHQANQRILEGVARGWASTRAR
jgi:3-oxoacyl-[acyl-carrier-protein] synthase-3